MRAPISDDGSETDLGVKQPRLGRPLLSAHPRRDHLNHLRTHVPTHHLDISSILWGNPLQKVGRDNSASAGIVQYEDLLGLLWDQTR